MAYRYIKDDKNIKVDDSELEKRMRRVKRVKELKIDLSKLEDRHYKSDSDEILRKLEREAVDKYIDNDKEVPEDLKKRIINIRKRIRDGRV